MPSVDPRLAARLPALHERQERQEAENVLASPIAGSLGIAARDWGEGLWSVRTPAAPEHGPGNQLCGLTEGTLGRLEEIIEWFDEAGCALRIRWPGAEMERDLGRRLGGLGFFVDELEAWMAAPIEALDVAAPSHDIRLAETPDDLSSFARAFCEGWQIEDPDKQRRATAAMAAHPSPDFWRRYVAWVDGEPAGEAVMALFGDAAYLAEASTAPRFRRRGVQRALIARRIADARAAGVTTMFGAVQYGDQSWANMHALGLREVFMTLTLVRAPRT